MAVGHLRDARGRVGSTIRADDELGSITEGDVDLDIVELEGNERKSETWETVEEEAHWDVDGGSWDGGSRGGQSGGVTDEVVVGNLLVRSESKLVVDFQPLTVLGVDGGSTNRQDHLRNHRVTQLTGPSHRAGGVCQSRQVDLQVDLLNQVGISRDDEGALAAERGLAREVQRHRLHSKWRDLSVDRLPQGSHRVTVKEVVLLASSHNLNQSSRRHIGKSVVKEGGRVSRKKNPKQVIQLGS